VNCENRILLVPTKSEPEGLLHIKPALSLTEPSWTNTVVPADAYPEAKSKALVGAPVALTVYIPFSIGSTWSFIKILLPVTKTIVSIVSPFSKLDIKVPGTVVATITEVLNEEVDEIEST
jgi:hypothetical protein